MNIDCVGISSENNLQAVYELLDKKISLQGNFDVRFLKSDNKVIKSEIVKTLDSFPYDTGHIFNLGTGITPDIDPDKVSYLVDTVQELSSK
tara:strand:+ start:64 stop:336 length:273 start_codon:yes stop_codon:yes gene_type:complete